jgi:hypothetical protein
MSTLKIDWPRLFTSQQDNSRYLNFARCSLKCMKSLSLHNYRLYISIHAQIYLKDNFRLSTFQFNPRFNKVIYVVRSLINELQL